MDGIVGSWVTQLLASIGLNAPELPVNALLRQDQAEGRQIPVCCECRGAGSVPACPSLVGGRLVLTCDTECPECHGTGEGKC